MPKQSGAYIYSGDKVYTFKELELNAVDSYIAQYVARWEVARESWVKMMIWELMIKRSRLQSKGV